MVRKGSVVTVKWHDTRNPQLVFLEQVDCAARTVRSLAVDEYDLLTGYYVDTKDLSQSVPQPIGESTTVGAHLAKAVC